MEGSNAPYQQGTPYGYGYGVPATAAENVVVVSDVFRCPYPVEMMVKKKLKGFSGAKFEVVDVKSNLHFHVDGPSDSFQKKRILRDASGYPLLTMREKVSTLNHRWTVHRGEGSDDRDLVFTVQRTHPLQWKTRLEVFLSTNQSRDVGNFHVIGGYSDDSAKVYRGSTLIAEVKDKSSFGGFFKGKQELTVRVNPGIDYAFAIALIVIFNEINTILYLIHGHLRFLFFLIFM